MGIHIVQNGKFWGVRRTGAKRALRKFANYNEAYDHAVNSVKLDEYIYLHGKCGRITKRIKPLV